MIQINIIAIKMKNDRINLRRQRGSNSRPCALFCCYDRIFCLAFFWLIQRSGVVAEWQDSLKTLPFSMARVRTQPISWVYPSKFHCLDYSTGYLCRLFQVQVCSQIYLIVRLFGLSRPSKMPIGKSSPLFEKPSTNSNLKARIGGKFVGSVNFLQLGNCVWKGVSEHQLLKNCQV